MIYSTFIPMSENKQKQNKKEWIAYTIIIYLFHFYFKFYRSKAMSLITVGNDHETKSKAFKIKVYNE